MDRINIKRLERLCNIQGVSSDEKEVKHYVQLEMKAYADEFLGDRLGSVFGVKKSKNEHAKTLMIACPLDEIGYMVTDITPEGWIKLLALEDISPVSSLHQIATCKTRNGQHIQGVIGCADVRFVEEKCTSIKEDALIFDCGKSYEEIVQEITVGDLVSIEGAFTELGSSTIASKALNQRIFLEVELKLLEQLKGVELDFNLVVGGVAQSTIGNRGTMTASYVVQPDIAIALAAFECANSHPKIQLGSGVVMGAYDKQMLPSQKWTNMITDMLPTINKTIGLAGNDGSFIHKTGKGTPCVSLGIPMAHTGTCRTMANVNDADLLVEALVKICTSLTSDQIEKIGFGVHYD